MISAVMAYIGIALVAVGALLVYPPAGLVVAGVGLIGAAYVRRFLEARREIARTPGR